MWSWCVKVCTNVADEFTELYFLDIHILKRVTWCQFCVSKTCLALLFYEKGLLKRRRDKKMAHNFIVTRQLDQLNYFAHKKYRKLSRIPVYRV